MGTRIVNFIIDQNRDIIAADSYGSLYRLDEHLKLKEVSQKTYHGAGIHTILADENWIFTRDVGGNLIRWHKDTLRPADFLVSEHFRVRPREGVYPVPTPTGAMAIRDGELFVPNAYGQLMVLGTDDMRCRRVMDIPMEGFPECLCLDVPGQDFISDVLGVVWAGDLGTGEFRPIAQVPNGNMHCVRYDARFDRLWLTSDGLGGIKIIDRGGAHIAHLNFTRDDVEELIFSSDFRYCYVVAFDHWLRVMENRQEPVEIGRIGPFKFQITHIRRQDDDTAFVSLESGEIYRIDLSNRRIVGSAFGTNAVWHVELQGDLLLCAMENGNVEVITLTDDGDLGPALQRQPLPNFGCGRVRKAIRVDDEHLLAITTSGIVINSDFDGRIRWKLPTEGILRDLDLSRDRMRAIACNEAGEVIEFDTASGRLLRCYRHSRPIWCLRYDHAGHILIGERYLTLTPSVADVSGCSDIVEGDRPPLDGQLVILDEKDFKPIHSITGGGNFKHIQRFEPGIMLINGNGNIMIRLFDVARLEFVETYGEWTINTPENAVIVGNHVYVVTYSQQLITYERGSGMPVNVQFSCEGLPFSLDHYQNREGAERLIVAGRDFLSVYSIESGIPQLMRTLILN